MILRQRPVSPDADRADGHGATSGRAPWNERGRNATAVVEFAVLLPFLMCILLGAIDLGRLFYYSMTIDNAMHNAMLFSAQSFDNQNQQWIGTDQYWQGPNGNLSDSTAAAQLDATNLTPSLPDANVTTKSTTDADGNQVVVVTVTYKFQALVPYPGLPSEVPIQRSGQVRVAPALPK
jgi:Flp pilus assembly protein TadG